MITSANSNASPMLFAGAVAPNAANASYYGYEYTRSSISGLLAATQTAPPQVMGLVPVFDCTRIECREGSYTADAIPNDADFMLPVFGTLPPPEGIPDEYNTDYNTFLFENIRTYDAFEHPDYSLEKKIDGVWIKQSDLFDESLGTPIQMVNECLDFNYSGYTINWGLVLQVFGEGIYRFSQATAFIHGPIDPYCAKSPPFCLKTFDCIEANRTTKFQTYISGGVFGSANKTQNGKVWSFCCRGFVLIPPVFPDPPILTYSSRNIEVKDSIRVEGLFGYEKTDYERKVIKYQTGVVNKIRDEAILKFTWKAGLLPFWFHERFKSYALMADILKVSDYNINNPDYNLKNYSVQSDSGYEPDYHGYSRYQKVNCEFKSGTQSLYRTRCC